jgi:hypothetical protein
MSQPPLADTARSALLVEAALVHHALLLLLLLLHCFQAQLLVTDIALVALVPLLCRTHPSEDVHHQALQLP